MTIEHSEPQNQPPIRVEDQGTNRIFFRGEEYAGHVYLCHNHPENINRGIRYSASFITSDEGVWNLGIFRTKTDATNALKEALNHNMTYIEWYQKAEEAK